ncbi:hypothetical protein JAAARDRAFT_37734, partial [Jaapia argillacea MUCL 33604]
MRIELRIPHADLIRRFPVLHSTAPLADSIASSPTTKSATKNDIPSLGNASANSTVGFPSTRGRVDDGDM